MSIDKKEIRTSEYWLCQGRKSIIIPENVMQQNIQDRTNVSHLLIREIGLYPQADEDFRINEPGCSEMLLILCVCGKGTLRTEINTFDVSPGQFFIMLQNEQPQYKSDADDPWSIYWIKIGGENISQFCDQPALRKCQRPSYVNNMVEVYRLLDDLIETLENDPSHDRIMYANLSLQRILALMIYDIQEIKKEFNRLSDNVIKFMKEHISEKYVLSKLAQKFGYSTSQFSNIFKKETAYSPIGYFTQLRVQHASKLLNITNLKINEIAREVGYTDPYHFSKIFKMTMDVSPEKYRSITSKEEHNKQIKQ
ncbi:MAG: AraC family transcriptional regulator [Pedobacter sp.]|uniref:AraC family transcriptional regulator n=1 Tax=Pedobacter sp. TaxID=1411316 RepID=UPI00339257C4